MYKSGNKQPRLGTINLRVSHAQRELIDRAAQVTGRNRSEFMLDAAAREAESVLLDRRYFSLTAEQFKRFTAMLDRPAHGPTQRNEKLRRLMISRAPWER